MERAKANRAARIAEQKLKTNAFIADEGLSNRALSQDLIPVQKGVYKLVRHDSLFAASLTHTQSSAGGKHST